MQSKALLKSWKRIWLAVHQRDNAAKEKRLKAHVDLFPSAEQPAALARALRIIETQQHHYNAVPPFVRRCETTLAATATITGAKPRANACAA